MKRFLIKAFDGNYCQETLTPAVITSLKALDSYYEIIVEATYSELDGIFNSNPNLRSRNAVIYELNS